jgi:hypothetical protein
MAVFVPATLILSLVGVTYKTGFGLDLLYLIIIIIIIIIIYLNYKWVFTRWQCYYNKTQHTNNTYHTK